MSAARQNSSMPQIEATTRDAHFLDGGAAYAAFRPSYPCALADALARAAPARRLALDVGCGSGQLSALLAARFARVVGVDVSADQLAHAAAAPNLFYASAAAEATPLPAGVVDLVTVAQAAHWLDLDAFYAEARRIASPAARVALISYGVTALDGPAAARFDRFYWDEMRAFWPPERRHVEEGYAALPFPFAEEPAPALEIRRNWALAELLGYVETWSATKAARRAGHGAVVDAFAADMAAAWGPASTRAQVVWPIRMRLGRIDGGEGRDG